MQRKRDISIYFLPVACDQSPQAITWPSVQRARGVYREKGGQFCAGGGDGALLGVLFGVVGEHDQDYIVRSFFVAVWSI